MKHLKSYENNNIDDYKVHVGDILYCINNQGVERVLEIGDKYTVDKIYNTTPFTFRLAETESRWMKFRFSPDSNHINIAKIKANKFNL